MRAATKKGGSMRLSSHLRELRNRLVAVAAVFFVATAACFNFVGGIAGSLMGKYPSYTFIYTAPAELFMQYVKLALVCGLVISLPVMLYNLWAFISQGLTRAEKGVVRASLCAGGGLFLLGAAFAYWVVIPFMMYFFFEFSAGQGVAAMVTVENYFGFLLSFLLTFGLVFEFPVVMVLLTQLGILKVKWLQKSRKLIVVAIFIVSAIITPPDVVSQAMVAVPLLCLFEISLGLCKALEKAKAGKAKAPGAR